MIQTASLGFSSVGSKNQHQEALDLFLNEKISENDLYKVGHSIRMENLQMYQKNNINIVPVNDFTWHDDVWDASVLIGNIPNRYYWEGGYVPLDIYFAPTLGQRKDKFEVPGCEIRPYFNTRSYYTVPEFEDDIILIQSDNKPVQHYIEAKKIHNNPRPVLLSPVSYVLLSKLNSSNGMDEDVLEKFLNDVLGVYQAVFANFKRLNIQEVQINDPCLSSTLSIFHKKLYDFAYRKMQEFAQGIKITTVLGFNDFIYNEDIIFTLPIDCIHLDITQQSIHNRLDEILAKMAQKTVSLGVINTTDVFVSDINSICQTVEYVAKKINNIVIAPANSLAHLPVDVEFESGIDKDTKKYLSFGMQKLEELSVVAGVLNGDQKAGKIASKITKLYDEIDGKISQLKCSKLPAYKREKRSIRKKAQYKTLGVKNILPMTTIGAFDSHENKKPTVADIKKYIKKQHDAGFLILSTGATDRNSSNFDYFTNFSKSGFIKLQSCIKTYFKQFENVPILINNIAILDNEKDVAKLFILTKQSADASKQLNKIVKYCLYGPMTSMHRSFCFNRYRYQEFYLSEFSSFTRFIIEKAIESGAGAIQIDENNIFDEFDTNITENKNDIGNLKSFIMSSYTNLDQKIPVHLYIKNANIIDSINDLNCLDVDLLILESARSDYDILKNISGYIYDGDVAIGVANFNSYYTTTLKDLNTCLKFAIRTFDINNLWITYDEVFDTNYNNSDEIVENINTAISAYKDKYSK